MFTSGKKPSRHAAAAEAMGFSYAPKADRPTLRAWRFLPEVPRGATLKHVMSGEVDGIPLTIFESSYVIMAGNTIIPVMSTLYAASAPPWPKLDVHPRNLLGRLLMTLGWRRGLMLENESFNRTFKLKTANEDFAVTLLGPDMQSFLLSKPNVKWRLGSGHACLVYSGKMKPDRLHASIQRMRTFWSHIPDELMAWE